MSKFYNTKYEFYRGAKFYDNAKMTDLLLSAREDLTKDEFDILDPINLDLIEKCEEFFKRKWYWTTKGIDQSIYIDLLDAYDSYIKAIKIVANVSVKRVGTEEYRKRVDRQMSRIEILHQRNMAARQEYEMYKMPSQEAFKTRELWLTEL